MDCFWKDQLPIHAVLKPAFLWRETAWPNFEDSFKTKSVLSVRWRNISDKQREKEHERARIHRQSISNKQREKKARANRLNCIVEQREKK